MAESFMYGLNASSIPYDGINKYLRITDIDDKSHKLIIDNLTSPNVKIEDSQEYLLKTGDLLFARTGASVGKTYLYNNLDGTVFFAGFLIRMRIKESYNRQFVFQSTLTEKYNNFIKITSQRSGQPGINAKEYSEFNLEVPSKITEQNRLGNLTERLDVLIDLYQEKLTLYESLKKYMLQALFPSNGNTFSKFKFNNSNDKWESRKLENLSKIITKGTTPKDKSWIGEVNYVKTESIDSHSGNISVTANTSIEEHDGYLKRSQLREGDILFSIVGTIGRVGIVEKKDLPANTNQQIAIIRLKNMNNKFVFYALKTNGIASFIKSDTTVGAQPSLSLWQINDLKIPYIDIGEQSNIANLLNKLDCIITMQKEYLQLYKHMKKYSLQKLFI